MRQEMRNLRTELQEHRVKWMEGNSRPWAPTWKGKQKTVRFCNYCHKNGHTPNWCSKKNARRRNTKKSKMKSPPKRIMFLTRTMALMLSTAAPNTIKVWTDLLIRIMATTQLTNFNLLKKKPGNMNPTKSLPLNKDTFTWTRACALMRHNSLQPRIWQWTLWPASTGLLKPLKNHFNNPTTNRHILTCVIMPGYKVPLTRIIFAVLFGISDVNPDIFERPWPYEKPTRNPEPTLRHKWKPKILHWEHIFMMDNL